MDANNDFKNTGIHMDTPKPVCQIENKVDL